jgi:DNA polymerase I-like protein with 3'-5' exonuclease and polymerase domains
MTVKPLETIDAAGHLVPLYLIDNLEAVSWFTTQINDARLAGHRIAVDTETHSWNETSHGVIRVLSACWPTDDGYVAAVIDFRDVEPSSVAPALSGVAAYGWNATFDARVTEDSIFVDGTPPIDWWDGMLADAVLHQGKTGFDFYHGLAVVARRLTGILLEGKGTTQVSFNAADDLTDDQVRYAALDAVATLLVCRELEILLEREGLTAASDLEQGARPFLDSMERHGIPIDWDSWKAYLGGLSAELDTALDRLAQLTGGGQPDIFTGLERPFWNPDSPDDVKRAFNDHATDLVKGHFKRLSGTPRLLGKVDKTDKDTLKEIGGDLAEALRDYKDLKKILSTYGDTLEKWIGDDGRIHPQYLQVIGTDTGRLSSRRPNAQNFTPRLKKHFRPPTQIAADGAVPASPMWDRILTKMASGRRRVFVYADLSQAELRDLAHESGDEGMLGAFRDGKDIHVATAERMFNIDMADLKESDPSEYKVFRSKAKTLNFGLVYGLGPKALARSLTLSGVPTDVDEAKALLKAYLDAYPGVREWLGARDSFIRRLAGNLPSIDWDATMTLKDLYGPLKSASMAFKKANGRDANDEELSVSLYSDATIREDLTGQLGRDPDVDEMDAERARRTDAVGWVRSFEGPVVICADGTPFTFASHTQIGRRRQFNVATESLLASMCLIAAQSPNPGPQRLRDQFAVSNGVALSGNGRKLGRDELAKVFEDRTLRHSFVEYLHEHATPTAFGGLVNKALADRISAMGNAYRNAPIQGGVADVALAAYGELHRRIGKYEDVWPVQTVHDSITLECWDDEAEHVAAELKSVLESAMSAICPTVPAVADADVRSSLDDKDVIAEL